MDGWILEISFWNICAEFKPFRLIGAIFLTFLIILIVIFWLIIINRCHFTLFHLLIHFIYLLLKSFCNSIQLFFINGICLASTRCKLCNFMKSYWKIIRTVFTFIFNAMFVIIYIFSFWFLITHCRVCLFMYNIFLKK